MTTINESQHQPTAAVAPIIHLVYVKQSVSSPRPFVHVHDTVTFERAQELDKIGDLPELFEQMAENYCWKIFEEFEDDTVLIKLCVLCKSIAFAVDTAKEWADMHLTSPDISNVNIKTENQPAATVAVQEIFSNLYCKNADHFFSTIKILRGLARHDQYTPLIESNINELEQDRLPTDTRMDAWHYVESIKAVYDVETLKESLSKATTMARGDEMIKALLPAIRHNLTDDATWLTVSELLETTCFKSDTYLRLYRLVIEYLEARLESHVISNEMSHHMSEMNAAIADSQTPAQTRFLLCKSYAMLLESEINRLNT